MDSSAGCLPPGLALRLRALPPRRFGYGLFSYGGGIGVQISRRSGGGELVSFWLDVDSGDGCSCSVAVSSVGISSSVFRVGLSVSGLRTFAIGCSGVSCSRGI